MVCKHLTKHIIYPCVFMHTQLDNPTSGTYLLVKWSFCLILSAKIKLNSETLLQLMNLN